MKNKSRKIGEVHSHEAVRCICNACSTHLRAVVKHLGVLLEEDDILYKEQLVEYRKTAFTLMGQFGTLAEDCSKCSVKRTESLEYRQK